MQKIKVGIAGKNPVGDGILAELETSSLLAKKSVINPKEEGALKALADDKEIGLVFWTETDDAYAEHVKTLLDAGKIVVNLTLSGEGEAMIPETYRTKTRHIDMVSTAAQATAPIVWAINQAAGVSYAEIIACIASKSVGKETRNHIDELTRNSSRVLETAGGADRGKAIMILNPAEPPLLMSNTVHCIVKNKDEEAVKKAVDRMVESIQAYAPGYSLRVPPIFDGDRVTVMMQMEARKGFFPAYCGDQEIFVSAAVKIAEKAAMGEERK